MQRPSEQLRRVLEELAATRVKDNQKSIAHLKLAHNKLSRLWGATLVAEGRDASSQSIGIREPIQLVIWKRHVRLCSLLDEFFQDGSTGTLSRLHTATIGAYRFTATREEHPDAPAHRIYTFALTSAGAGNDHARLKTASSSSNSPT